MCFNRDLACLAGNSALAFQGVASSQYGHAEFQDSVCEQIFGPAEVAGLNGVIDVRGFLRGAVNLLKRKSTGNQAGDDFASRAANLTQATSAGKQRDTLWTCESPCYLSGCSEHRMTRLLTWRHGLFGRGELHLSILW